MPPSLFFNSTVFSATSRMSPSNCLANVALIAELLIGIQQLVDRSPCSWRASPWHPPRLRRRKFRPRARSPRRREGQSRQNPSWHPSWHRTSWPDRVPSTPRTSTSRNSALLDGSSPTPMTSVSSSLLSFSSLAKICLTLADINARCSSEPDCCCMAIVNSTMPRRLLRKFSRLASGTFCTEPRTERRYFFVRSASAGVGIGRGAVQCFLAVREHGPLALLLDDTPSCRPWGTRRPPWRWRPGPRRRAKESKPSNFFRSVTGRNPCTTG